MKIKITGHVYGFKLINSINKKIKIKFICCSPNEAQYLPICFFRVRLCETGKLKVVKTNLLISDS